MKRIEREKVTIQLDRLQLAGTLILLAGIQFIIGLSIAESTYQGYSINQNLICDLGATVRLTESGVSTIIHQPASIIFTAIIIIMGAFIIAAVYLIYPTAKARRPMIFLALLGIAAVGIGIFSEVFGVIHGIFSLMSFFFGALAAIDSFRLEKRPTSYISPILGVIALVAIPLLELASLDQILPEMGVAAATPLYTPLGIGGLERMIAYPVLIWLVMFGASLIASPETVVKSA